MTMSRLLVLLLVMGGVPELAGQVQPLWTVWYDGMAKYDDYPAGVAVDSQGNVIVGGSSHAFYAFPGGGRSDFDSMESPTAAMFPRPSRWTLPGESWSRARR